MISLLIVGCSEVEVDEIYFSKDENTQYTSADVGSIKVVYVESSNELRVFSLFNNGVDSIENFEIVINGVNDKNLSPHDYLNDQEKPAYTFTALELSTEKGVQKAMDAMSNVQNGIIIFKAGDQGEYEASGHIDLIYRDWWGDLSIEGYSGYDLDDYLNGRTSSKLSIEIWTIDVTTEEE